MRQDSRPCSVCFLQIGFLKEAWLRYSINDSSMKTGILTSNRRKHHKGIAEASSQWLAVDLCR